MSKKKQSAGYMEATAVSLALQQSLMDHHDDSCIEPQDVLCMFSRKPLKERGGFVPFKVSKLSGLPSVLAQPKGEDGVFQEPLPRFLVLVHYDAWHLMPEAAQSAMCDKALCHCEKVELEKGGPRLSVVKCDIEEFSEVEVRHGRNWLPAGLMAHAVSGQPSLTIAEPEPNKFAPEPKPTRSKRHDKEYAEGRLGAS